MQLQFKLSFDKFEEEIGFGESRFVRLLSFNDILAIEIWGLDFNMRTFLSEEQLPFDIKFDEEEVYVAGISRFIIKPTQVCYKGPNNELKSHFALANFMQNEEPKNADYCYIFGGAYGNKYEEIEINSNEPIHLFLDPKDIINGKDYVKSPDRYSYQAEPKFQKITLENFL
ncbi:hypothetical protein QNH39_14910 [Neobacillus novalis]|uniref:Uncharacterized protein n=1 Tax=Neobacillus novalis TaxID=220687 RepID=A0AA95MI25_9BACI|nr:hypothetical protein [Neobacillus novalis]WHY83975.1 hypothetical protein QNH39_14910 [Neobacillus novalis]